MIKNNLPAKIGINTYCVLGLCFIALFTIIFSSCSENKAEQKQLQLDDRYLQIKEIVAIADCTGPRGKYTTEVRSSSDGSCYFLQKNDSDPSPFIAKINSKNEGFTLDSTDSILDTLSKEAIAMIKGHEFHKLHTNPGLSFSNILFHEETNILGINYEVYNASDRLDNPIKLYYNRQEEVLSKIELLNSMDTSQVIQIINEKWMESEYGKMVEKTKIVQAEKDTFSFIFNTLKIN